MSYNNTKISFIRKGLQYFKIVRDNRYVTEIKIFEQEWLWIFEFQFKPFNNEHSVQIALTLHDSLNDITIKVFSEKSPTRIYDNYFASYSRSGYKHITPKELESLLHNVHDWLIDILYDSIKRYKPKYGRKTVIRQFHEYIPSSFMDPRKVEEYAKTRVGIRKYNL